MCIPLPPSPMFSIFHPRSLLGIQVGARFNTASQHDFRTLQALILVLCKQTLLLVLCKLCFCYPASFDFWCSASSDFGALQASSVFGTLQALIFGTLQALTLVLCKQALFLVACKL